MLESAEISPDKLKDENEAREDVTPEAKSEELPIILQDMSDVVSLSCPVCFGKWAEDGPRLCRMLSCDHRCQHRQ